MSKETSQAQTNQAQTNQAQTNQAQTNQDGIYNATMAPILRFRLMIWLVALCLGVFIFWSAHAPLDEIVRGPGKVVPNRKTQIIQSLEGGILSQLLVREGDEIAKGAVVARLSDKKFKGIYAELEKQVMGLKIKLIRLDAEMKKKRGFTIVPAMQQSNPKIAAAEQHLFKARKKDYEATRVSLRDAYRLKQDEVMIYEKLARKKLVAPIEVLKAKQAAGKAKGDLNSFETEFKLARSEEHTAALTELNTLIQSLESRKDQLDRTTLVSPVKGIVNKVLISTIGGVIAPGEPILELIPLDDDLLVEAKISPKDIAFIYPDMRATIKLSAYDYSIYGDLSGHVKHISADTFEDERSRESQPYYKVLIAVDEKSRHVSQSEIEIRPGMVAQTELHVGSKTVLKYLLKPLFKASEAFREP